jgi:hypothetical protein
MILLICYFTKFLKQFSFAIIISFGAFPKIVVSLQIRKFQNEDHLDFDVRNLLCKVETFVNILKAFETSIAEKNSITIEGLDDHWVDSFLAFVKSLLNFIDRYEQNVQKNVQSLELSK